MADSMGIGVVQKIDYVSPNKSEIKDLEAKPTRFVQAKRQSSFS